MNLSPKQRIQSSVFFLGLGLFLLNACREAELAAPLLSENIESEDELSQSAEEIQDKNGALVEKLPAGLQFKSHSGLIVDETCSNEIFVFQLVDESGNAVSSLSNLNLSLILDSSLDNQFFKSTTLCTEPLASGIITLLKGQSQISFRMKVNKSRALSALNIPLVVEVLSAPELSTTMEIDILNKPTNTFADLLETPSFKTLFESFFVNGINPQDSAVWNQASQTITATNATTLFDCPFGGQLTTSNTETFTSSAITVDYQSSFSNCKVDLTIGNQIYRVEVDGNFRLQGLSNFRGKHSLCSIFLSLEVQR